MKIAIIGGAGGIGSLLAEYSLTAGHDVSVLVRNPARVSVKGARLRVLIGNAEDEASITELVEGQDVVCDCLGTTQLFREIRTFSRCATHLAKALRPAQLLIAVTGMGVGDSAGHGTLLYDKVFRPVFLGRMYADKERQEQIILAEIARWIIVRPGFLNNGPRTGRYRALTDLSGIQGGRISRADVADFVLSQASSARFLRQTPLLIY